MKPKALNWRNLFLNLHLWLGLGSSLIVLVLCLTGTLLGLQGPVETWVNRDVLKVAPQGAPMALETLVPRVAEETGKAFTALVVKPGADDALQLLEGRKAIYVNPYTGEVLGGFDPVVSEAFLTLFKLHRWLLLDMGPGRVVTGAATVIFVVTLATGVILWWPRRLAQWARALRFRRGLSWKGLNYDLHVVLGAYAAIPLLVMGLSGLYWSYHAPFEAAVYRLLDGKAAPDGEHGERRGARPGARSVTALPYARILEETNRAYPHAGPVRIMLPAKVDKPVQVRKLHQPTALSIPYADGLSLDARTGEVLRRAPFSEGSRAERLLSLIKDIHVGTVFGGLSLAIYVVAALIGTSLPLTGLLHWLTKLRARRRRRSPGGSAGEPLPSA